MNWASIFEKVLTVYFHFFIIIITYYIAKSSVLTVRKKKNSPATLYEKIYFFLITLGVILIISVIFGSSNDEDEIVNINNYSVVLVFLTLSIPASIGLLESFSKDKKISTEDRLKQRYYSNNDTYEDKEEDIYFGIGLEYFKQKKYDEALKIFDGSVDRGIELKAFTWRAMCLQQLNFHLEAIEDLDKAILLESDKADLYHLRSMSKRDIGDFEGEIYDLQEAIRLSKPDNENNRYWNNYSKESSGFESATSFYQWSLEMAQIGSNHLKENFKAQLQRRKPK